MTKELKEILDGAEFDFYYLNKNQLSILRHTIQQAYHQGGKDYLEKNYESIKN